MLSVASVTMNGCGRRPVHEDDAVDGADCGSGGEHHEDHDRPRCPGRDDQRTHDRPQGEGGADGQVDAARDDDQQLPIASTEMTADCARTLPMFRAVRKAGVSWVRITTRIRRPIGPIRRKTRPDARTMPRWRHVLGSLPITAGSSDVMAGAVT